MFVSKLKKSLSPQSSSDIDTHFHFSDEDITKLIKQINRLVGQIEAVKADIRQNSACPDSLIQILAARGALERIGKDMIQKGVLDCLSRYDKQTMEVIIRDMLKL